MLRLAQFRYYGNNNDNNYPAKSTMNFYCVDASFQAYKPIRQLGIQTLPGTKFYINQSQSPIIVGGTGIFEIDCTNTTAIINSIRFDKDSMTTINNLENGYLIIDILYGEEGANS